MWRHALEVKFVMALMLTPLMNPVARNMHKNDESAQASFTRTIQFIFVVLLLIFSVCIRAFREDVCNNFAPSPLAEKFSDISNKLGNRENGLSTKDIARPSKGG